MPKDLSGIFLITIYYNNVIFFSIFFVYQSFFYKIMK